jgi:hypothetical protein
VGWTRWVEFDAAADALASMLAAGLKNLRLFYSATQGAAQ